MQKDTLKKCGAVAGATGGGILGLKIGMGLYLLMVAVNPFHAFLCAGLPTAAAGLGGMLGGMAGYNNPAGGLLSVIANIFGFFGHGFGEGGAPDVLDS